MGTCFQRSGQATFHKDSGGKYETVTQKADSMQQVLKNIYMGSAIAAKNKELLLENGVTHIIALRLSHLITH